MNESSEILKIKKLGKQIRSNILKMSLVAGASSSHFGGALSTVEILATLYNSVLKFDVKNYDIRCHKLLKNNLFRLHFDDYAGSYSANLNFNKTWKWDWGGILSIAGGNNSEKLYSVLPNWNSMNIVYSGKNNSPHFVTPVQSFAKNPRYSMTIFVK